jgi:hypothetical protein
MNKQASFSKKLGQGILIAIGILVVILVAGYFVANSIIHKKVDEALRALPPSLKVTYTGLHPSLLRGALVIDGLEVHFAPEEGHAHDLSVKTLTIGGIRFLELLKDHRLHVRNIDVDGVTAHLDEYLLKKNQPMPEMPAPPFNEALIGRIKVTGLNVTEQGHEKKSFSMEGSFEVDSVALAAGGARTDSTGQGKIEGPGKGRLSIGGFRFVAEKASYVIPDMDEVAHLVHLEVDSRKSLLRLDTLRIRPTMDREEIGRAKGHQVDVFTVTSHGISIDKLDVMALMQHQLTADRIEIGGNEVHVFRDRRLPLPSGEKAMPADGLRTMSVMLRVRTVKLGPTFFEYEEFPKKGNKSGALKIYHLTGTIRPLINKPVEGDPAYIKMTTEGSLMNSGSVTATTMLPLHKGDPYKVEGAFHDLDVTKLNDPAENLGGLHLESGMLNSLQFWFEMNDEKATGHILGEYHDLVVDKLKETGGSKIAKAKSFALKKFIIPKDKDKSLPESKRTGKVDYKRDKEREFSYYLLHSLLVGVKSSFSLGFLLPG